MKKAGLFLCAAALLFLGSYRHAAEENDLLKIKPLTGHVLLHVSFLQTEQWGDVACNGIVFIRNGEALVIDAPTNNAASEALISRIQSEYGAQVKGVVVNHFHDDCLGGLNAFHKRGIPSYASKRTIALAKRDTTNRPEVPQYGFGRKLVLTIGGEEVISRYFGGAHTSDNIVSYIPSEKLLFGGCMIKAQGAQKGNLADADVQAWPKTVKKVRNAFREVKTVVPGHGETGGPEPLDYTIALFSEK